MKKIFEALRVPTIILLLITSFVACDKDFYVLDNKVLGKDNANFNTNEKEYPIISYNKKLNGIQINNLPSNLLGYFNDLDFGGTTASIITDVTPTSFPSSSSPKLFGDNPVVDSVILTIPYFSRVTSIGDDGLNEYTINDSLYGSINNAIKLSVFENGYFLRDIDPNNLGQSQRYYASSDNGTSDNYAQTEQNLINFDALKGTDSVMVLNEYLFSDKIVVTTTSTDTVRTAPAIRLHLNPSFWKSKIVDKDGGSELSNANNFKNYFRGLYLKAEAVNGLSSMVMLNLNAAEAGITLYYTRDDEDNQDERVSGTYSMNFSGSTLNTFINNYDIVNLADGDTANGDESLYLKGAEGSMAIVDLFPTDAALKAFLDEYRVSDGDTGYLTDNSTGNFILKKLINEAHLLIYEDDVQIISDNGNADYHKYDRLYAFDIKNSIPTVDYSADLTDNLAIPVNSKIVHLTQRDTTPGEHKYKIRLTQHLNNLLLRDSIHNTKIGLVLSSNVNIIANSGTLDENNSVAEPLNVENVPATSVITPRGTILVGTNITDTNHPNYDKRLKLKVFATETK